MSEQNELKKYKKRNILTPSFFTNKIYTLIEISLFYQVNHKIDIKQIVPLHLTEYEVKMINVYRAFLVPNSILPFHHFTSFLSPCVLVLASQNSLSFSFC